MTGNDFVADVDLIDRVEIIRGPGSTLYGSNAFIAVINVITRKPSDFNGLEASAEAGTFSTYKGRVSYGRVFESGLSILFSGSMADSQGQMSLYYPEFDRKETNYGLAQGLDGDRHYNGIATIQYKDFTFQAGYVWRWKDVPTAPYVSLFNTHLYGNTERTFARLLYSRTFSTDTTVRADLHWDRFSFGGDFPADGTFITPSGVSSSPASTSTRISRISDSPNRTIRSAFTCRMNGQSRTSGLSTSAPGTTPSPDSGRPSTRARQ
jgi:iron complex outermembrane receptor protein